MKRKAVLAILGVCWLPCAVGCVGFDAYMEREFSADVARCWGEPCPSGLQRSDEELTDAERMAKGVLGVAAGYPVKAR